MSPKIVDRIEQRADIRAAALRTFRRRGVGGTGLFHVAREAGVGRSTLYHYYSSRADIVDDLVKDLLEAEQRLFASIEASDASALERLRNLCSALPLLFEEWRAVGLLFLELQTHAKDRLAPFYREVRAILARLVADGQRGGEFRRDMKPEIAATTILGLIDGVLLQHCFDPDAVQDVHGLSRAVERVLMSALARDERSDADDG